MASHERLFSLNISLTTFFSLLLVAVIYLYSCVLNWASGSQKQPIFRFSEESKRYGKKYRFDWKLFIGCRLVDRLLRWALMGKTETRLCLFMFAFAFLQTLQRVVTLFHRQQRAATLHRESQSAVVELTSPYLSCPKSLWISPCLRTRRRRVASPRRHSTTLTRGNTTLQSTRRRKRRVKRHIRMDLVKSIWARNWSTCSRLRLSLMLIRNRVTLIWRAVSTATATTPTMTPLRGRKSTSPEKHRPFRRLRAYQDIRLLRKNLRQVV